MRRALLALALAAAIAGCGDDDDDTAGGTSGVVVSAASSLRDALTSCASDAKLSFAGSDQLAAQIREGVRPDVFAAANTKLPEALAEEGLLETPVVFATNTLVLAVPAEDAKIASLDDLGKDGTRIAIGAEGVPIGDYTREVLGRLDEQQSQAILAHVRSEEPEVSGIVGKLVAGAVDAGFVYRTDVTATDGELTAIELAVDLQPTVEYGAGVVKGAKDPDGARTFVDGLTDGACADALREAGFGAP